MVKVKYTGPPLTGHWIGDWEDGDEGEMRLADVDALRKELPGRFNVVEDVAETPKTARAGAKASSRSGEKE